MAEEYAQIKSTGTPERECPFYVTEVNSPDDLLKMLAELDRRGYEYISVDKDQVDGKRAVYRIAKLIASNLHG